MHFVHQTKPAGASIKDSYQKASDPETGTLVILGASLCIIYIYNRAFKITVMFYLTYETYELEVQIEGKKMSTVPVSPLFLCKMI